MELKTIGRNRKKAINEIIENGNSFRGYSLDRGFEKLSDDLKKSKEIAKHEAFLYNFTKVICDVKKGDCTIRHHSNNFVDFKIDPKKLNQILIPETQKTKKISKTQSKTITKKISVKSMPQSKIDPKTKANLEKLKKIRDKNK